MLYYHLHYLQRGIEMLVICISFITLIVDQITKVFIANNEAFHHIEVIKNFFYITYAENTGMAWSLLSGKQAFLTIVSAVAIGVMIYYLIAKSPNLPTRVAIALMIGGAAGNLVDRLFLSYVRDFLDFIVFGYDFPIFNIADSALTIGVILLFLITIKDDGKKHES